MVSMSLSYFINCCQLNKNSTNLIFILIDNRLCLLYLFNKNKMNKMISSQFKILVIFVSLLVFSAKALFIDIHKRSSILHLNYKDNL